MGASIGMLLSGLGGDGKWQEGLSEMKSGFDSSRRSCQRRLAPKPVSLYSQTSETRLRLIITNKPFGTLYIGVTSNLPARIFQHKHGTGSDFCRENGLDRLVYVENYPRIAEAIAREKAMKAWKRRWKTDLIIKANPNWDDLWDVINA